MIAFGQSPFDGFLFCAEAMAVLASKSRIAVAPWPSVLHGVAMRLEKTESARTVVFYKAMSGAFHLCTWSVLGLY